jgi:hypothetical protein
MSSLFSALIYWQLMRIRYLMSYNIQGAFRRLDGKISGFTNSPSCPGIIRTVYEKARGFMISMSDMGQNGQPNAAGGASGGLGGMMSRCNIF